MLAIAEPTAPSVPPPHFAWWTPARDLALRLVIALAFLAGLGAVLTVFAPPPAGPAVRFVLPPTLPDPAALLPYLPETARTANAAMPIEPPSMAAPAFRLAPAGTAAADPGAQARALDCLAAAAWYEAGDDPPGMRAVVQVVLNRARHPAFPPSVCGVVFQGSERITGCQFSFTCDGSMHSRQPGSAVWARARAVASAALAGAVDPRVGLATHYHADYVVPVWRSGLVKLAKVGLHLFYRWPGTWGAPAALRAAASGNEPRIPALAARSAAHDGTGLAVMPGALPALDPAPAARSGAPLAYLPLDEVEAPPRPGPHMALLSGYSSDESQGSAPAGGTGRIMLMLDPSAFPGTYAMRALAACADRSRCAVIGELLGTAPAHGPAFVYVRDRRSGAEGAWWDCQALPRANRGRCLPQGSALSRLLAEWR